MFKGYLALLVLAGNSKPVPISFIIPAMPVEAILSCLQTGPKTAAAPCRAKHGQVRRPEGLDG
ncbi:hypothetical protein O166_23940 [Pseudogulbenkiania ferrooxidans EGD-HP2]|uniref:Transposase n=1 Tax=Pseudogulbenkiania ferrooxidans EGD-HP2 TaxID=1388764 RepID=A0ABP2XQV6_9NEIS|nr:hypothetical protein O166_23940 [Pseudogulbenkiania ferrooxidans EGD-HP2]